MALTAPPVLSRLRVRLILLVLLAILPALAISIYDGFEQRSRAAAAANTEALQLVSVAASQNDQMVTQTERVLQGLSAVPAVRGSDAAACSSFMAGVLRGQNLYANFGVIDLNGNI